MVCGFIWEPALGFLWSLDSGAAAEEEEDVLKPKKAETNDHRDGLKNCSGQL